ncbi:unnamed protein product [Caenorhabditis auriculariae]|uniref:Uncharacterized protein n=1 Tax=Caenorhabditis auriculariae TaxID=2777116 RepID=A0A8S1GXF8_9PELO|nr:unnamed protein product [Caenorhabditis auriculariae]
MSRRVTAAKRFPNFEPAFNDLCAKLTESGSRPQRDRDALIRGGRPSPEDVASSGHMIEASKSLSKLPYRKYMDFLTLIIE